MQQDHYSWPKWGQHVETKGKNGEPVDLPEAQRLLGHYKTWATTADPAVKAQAWRDMLANNARNQWTIGTISGAIQPVVASKGLKNVPGKALYSWEPTSLLGVYRPDEFYWDIGSRKEAMAR